MTERLEALPGVQKVTFSSMHVAGRKVRVQRSVYLRSALMPRPMRKAGSRRAATAYPSRARKLSGGNGNSAAGRTHIQAQDDARAPKVVVVNQTFAKKYFPNENPIGKRFTFRCEQAGRDRNRRPCQRREIHAAARRDSADGLPALAAGTALDERRDFRSAHRRRSDSRVAAVRQAMREVDENLPLINVRTQIEQADETLRMERLFAKLLTLFGLLAQQLAAIGLVRRAGLCRLTTHARNRHSHGARRRRPTC